MSFEEEFPSLKNINSTGDSYGQNKAFGEYHIIKYCLDKQRVKEAIKNTSFCEDVSGYPADIILTEELLDILGLEDK
jgi:hypothetical protein